MHQIRCPHCGVRDEYEFRYRGDASVTRPAADAGRNAFYDHVYVRKDPKGWHIEWWHHVGGCRQWVKVVRNTLTHEIARTGTAGETLTVPTA
ncbi:MAG TPA: sarcosine oxidase subunit delta [Hyphomicrobiaceae bacterium]|nr:sarcosine oxidase subunit delta [Hyphomicrobiaceae bacterium]